MDNSRRVKASCVWKIVSRDLHCLVSTICSRLHENLHMICLTKKNCWWALLDVASNLSSVNWIRTREREEIRRYELNYDSSRMNNRTSFDVSSSRWISQFSFIDVCENDLKAEKKDLYKKKLKINYEKTVDAATVIKTSKSVVNRVRRLIYEREDFTSFVTVATLLFRWKEIVTWRTFENFCFACASL